MATGHGAPHEALVVVDRSSDDRQAMTDEQQSKWQRGGSEQLVLARERSPNNSPTANAVDTMSPAHKVKIALAVHSLSPSTNAHLTNHPLILLTKLRMPKIAQTVKPTLK